MFTFASPSAFSRSRLWPNDYFQFVRRQFLSTTFFAVRFRAAFDRSPEGQFCLLRIYWMELVLAKTKRTLISSIFLLVCVTARFVEPNFYKLRTKGFLEIVHLIPTIWELIIIHMRRDSLLRMQGLYEPNSPGVCSVMWKYLRPVPTPLSQVAYYRWFGLDGYSLYLVSHNSQNACNQISCDCLNK